MNEDKEKLNKKKIWKFYLLPTENPKELAKKGLVITLVMYLLSQVTGSIVRDLADIFTTYGVLLLLVALFKWIKNKISSKK